MALAVLILTLIVPQMPVPAGQPIPIGLELRNVSDRPVWVTGVLDGSEEGVRFPHFIPRILRNGSAVAGPPVAEDPLVSPLRLEDFTLLQPGQSLDPIGQMPLFTLLNFRPDGPGEYEISVTFSTESGSPEEWLGRFAQGGDREALLRRIAEVPPVTLTATATVAVR